MFIKKTSKVVAILLVPIALLLHGCGGGSGGGGGGGDKLKKPIGDLSGSWTVNETVDARDCFEGIYDQKYSIQVSQSGNKINVSTNEGNFTGTLSGNTLKWSGSFPEDGGTTQSSVKLTVAGNCQEISGKANWKWSDGDEKCSGSTSIRVIRNAAIGCDGNSTAAPRAPSNLVATAQSAGSIRLDWIDNAADETGYVVQRGATEDGPFANFANLAAGSDAYVDAGNLRADTTYYYRVYATSGGTEQGFSGAAFASTLAAAVPAAPTDLVAVEIHATTGRIGWSDSGATETGYLVEASTHSPQGPFNELASLPENATTYDAALSPGTTYYLRVAAFNADGISDSSNVLEIRTAEGAPGTGTPAGGSIE